MKFSITQNLVLTLYRFTIFTSFIKGFFITLFFFPMIVFAQNDSIQHIKEGMIKVDSTGILANQRIDAIQSNINQIANPNLRQLGQAVNQKRKTDSDSIRFLKKKEKERRKIQAHLDRAMKENRPTERYVQQLDSLDKATYLPDASFNKRPLQSLQHTVAYSSDSLKRTDPLSGVNHKVDGLKQTEPLKKVNEVEAKIDHIEQKLNAPVNKAESTVNEKISLMNQEGGTKANLPSGMSIPDAGVKTDLNLSSPELNTKVDNPLSNQMGEAGQKVADMKTIPQEQIGKVNSIDEIKSAQGKIGEANVITDKVQGYGDDVKNISQGNLSEIKEAPKTLEDQVRKMDEVNGIQKEAAVFDKYKGMAGKANDPAALKQEAMKQVSNAAMDHFSGKEEMLKAAMNQMNKLKSKFSDIKSLSEVPKRKPNEMKDKPLIERIVPGITLQIQKTKDVLLDYNPYLGYRFYGKFTAGGGWNERVTIGRHFHLSDKDRIYGPRVFADFKWKGGFSLCTDIEKMNTFIPAVTATGLTGDPSHRAWVWSAFIGIKKEYKFAGPVRGNAQFLYNLYDDHYNSPYTDRFVVRMGFDFPMKKKAPNN